MGSLKVHTIATAPGGSKRALEMVAKKQRHIPNLWGTFANSPVLLNGYVALNREWERSSLTAREREIVFLSVSVANNCPYCIAGYTAGLRRMGVGTDLIRQILDNESIQDPKISALVGLVREVVANRGFVAEPVRNAFTTAGYPETVILEILVGVALKTMANYLDHLFPIPVDQEYQAEYLKVISEAHE